jgi:hypothetical protein
LKSAFGWKSVVKKTNNEYSSGVLAEKHCPYLAQFLRESGHDLAEGLQNRTSSFDLNAPSSCYCLILRSSVSEHQDLQRFKSSRQCVLFRCWSSVSGLPIARCW